MPGWILDVGADVNADVDADVARRDVIEITFVRSKDKLAYCIMHIAYFTLHYLLATLLHPLY